jgi:hypothetical protein
VIEYQNWITKGIRYIGNLIDENGDIQTKENLTHKFGLNCQQLQYQSIVTAIPTQWKSLIKQNKGAVCFDTTAIECAIKIKQTYANISEINTRDIYWHLLENKSKRPTSEVKWNEKLPFLIDENMWTIIYTNDQHVTCDTYVRNLQYKITHRILACNKNLQIWKIKQSNECDYCKEADTIEHFLVECTNTYTMWQHIFNWWASNMEAWFQVNTYEIIFGVPNEFNEPIVNQINFIILSGKYYIYRNKKKNKPLHLYEFLLDCKNQMEIKYEIMSSKAQLKWFETEWGDLPPPIVGSIFEVMDQLNRTVKCKKV